MIQSFGWEGCEALSSVGMLHKPFIPFWNCTTLLFVCLSKCVCLSLYLACTHAACPNRDIDVDVNCNTTYAALNHNQRFNQPTPPKYTYLATSDSRKLTGSRRSRRSRRRRSGYRRSRRRRRLPPPAPEAAAAEVAGGEVVVVVGVVVVAGRPPPPPEASANEALSAANEALAAAIETPPDQA